MADLTKKKLLSEYPIRPFITGDALITYRASASDNEKTGRSVINAGTAEGIADGSDSTLKMYSDSVLKDAVEEMAVDAIYGGSTLIESAIGGTSIAFASEPELGLYLVELTTPAGLGSLVFEITGRDTNQVIGATVIGSDLVNIVGVYDSSTTTMTISDVRSDGSTNAVVIGDLYRVGA